MGFAFATLDALDPVMHTHVCRWLAAREILQGKNPNATAEDHAWKDAARLYCECAALIREYEATKDDESAESTGAIDARALLLGDAPVAVAGGDEAR